MENAHLQAKIVVKDNARFIQTANNTELPLLQLGKKDYLQVAHRLVWFREEHPDWQIITKPLEISLEKKYAIFRASVIDDQGRVLATGTKAESIQGFADYIEKAETGATGRALALVGYGTQYAPELDEGERLADSPIDAPKKAIDAPSAPKDHGETCNACGSGNMTIGMTKADNPRNPNRPYWKCLDCPPEKSFSHWVAQKDMTLVKEAV